MSRAPQAPPLCIVCGGDRSRRASADVNRRDGLAVVGEYRECLACGHLFLAPMPTAEELKEYYRAATLPTQSSGASAKNPGSDFLARGIGFLEHRLVGKRAGQYHAAHRHLPEHPGGRPRLLDMGCGEGATLQGFTGRGWQICGVDISPTAIAAARRCIPEGTFQVSDLEEAELDLGRFDFVRLDNVLEHVLHPERVLRAARSYLRNRGELAIYVPHGRSLSMRLFRSRSISHWVPFHLNLFTRASLTALLERAGFTQIQITYLDPASWWTLTMAQVVSPNIRLSQEGPRVAHSAALRALGLPFRCLSPYCGGEELFALARRGGE